jgi:CBS domain-containing protein
LHVKDIMDFKNPTIYADDLVTKARALIREYMLRILPIINENRKLLGVVTRGDVMIITSSVSPMRVKGIMTNPKHVVSLDDGVDSAVKQMLKVDEWWAPVVNSPQDKTYRGVFGLEHFLESIIRTSPERLAKPVSEFMSNEIVSCSPNDEIEKVWRLMQEKSLSGLPVTQCGKLVGIVSQRDLLENSKVFPEFESKKGRFRASPNVASIMKTNLVSIESSVEAIQVAKVMVRKNIGRIPVKDKGEKLIGIVDREDIVRLLVR